MPFLTLAVVIAVGAIADRLGVFRLLAKAVLSEKLHSLAASISVLTFTAVISGVLNLDVAAVVAPPLAIRVAALKGLNPARLLVSTALAANATSFLLPSSNLTNLLVLDRSPIPVIEYVREDWVAWLLVSVLTVGWLALLNRPTRPSSAAISKQSTTHRALVPTTVDLLLMFVIASAIRALLGGGLTLHGGFVEQFAVGSLLAAGANNLPAAAAVNSAASGVPWAAIWAMAMGPNLLVTGSVASIICRRIALGHGVRFGSITFSLLGAVMLPIQFLAACAGLQLVRLG
jgi:arsenical pump membrane protein